jgi:hypothetical protein
MEKLEMKRYIFALRTGGQSQFLRTCPVADEERSAGSTSMASENFWMDGVA